MAAAIESSKASLASRIFVFVERQLKSVTDTKQVALYDATTGKRSRRHNKDVIKDLQEKYAGSEVSLAPFAR